MDIDEVLAKIKYISTDLCDNKLAPFCESLDEITTSLNSVKYQDDNQSTSQNRGCLSNLYNKIQPSCQISVDNGKEVLENNFKILNEKRAQVRHLEQVLKKCKTEHENKEKQVNKIKKQCEHFEDKVTGLQNLKDCIKTYKLLTGTHFAYKKETTMGYIKGSNPQNFEVFEFNNTQMSQQDITKKVWTLLENVSKEDSKNRTEHIKSNKKLILS